MLEQLQEIGLTKKESQVYLLLARMGELTGNSVAKQLSIHRTVAYNVLQQLVEKGLVTYIKKEKKRFFLITNPQSLLMAVKEKEIIVEGIIKEMQHLRSIHPSQHSVEVYEGKSGLLVVFNEISQARDLRVLNATGLLFQYLKFSAKHLIDELVSHGRPRLIAVNSMKKTPLARVSKQHIKYLPREAENYATTFIFEGKVIIQVLKDKPFLIRIENDEIFDGYKKDFDVLWKKL